jgi:hypothetical protein
MLKSFLAGGSLLILLAVSGLPASAQNSAPAPAPAASPASVSPDELQKFASAIKKMLLISQDTETQMVQAVQQTGLSEARFNEIYLSKKDPAAKLKTPITQSEQQNYDQAIVRLNEIEKNARTKIDSTVKGEGLEPQRFSQILAAVKGNPQLRQEVQKMIQSQ